MDSTVHWCVAADGTDTASGFTELVRRHRAELEPGLGRLDERRIADLRQELVDMVMLDDDMDSPPDPSGDVDSRLATPSASLNSIGDTDGGSASPSVLPDPVVDSDGRSASSPVPPDSTADTRSRPASPPARPDPTADTLRHLANDVLARPAPPPATPQRAVRRRRARHARRRCASTW